MKPEEFWSLQQWEFILLCHAALEEQADERRFQALMVADLMNCWRKKTVTVDHLLGISKPTVVKSADQLIGEAKQCGRTYADYCKEHGIEKC